MCRRRRRRKKRRRRKVIWNGRQAVRLPAGQKHGWTVRGRGHVSRQTGAKQ